MFAAPLLLLAMLVQSGGAAAVSSDPARAVVELQEAIRNNPDVESNYTDLGNLLLRTQNFREAALVLEAACAKFPASGQAALSLAVAYYGLRRFPDAVTALLEAGRLEPAAQQPVAFLARLAEHWGERTAEVVSLFEAFAQQHPDSALGQFALGRATGSTDALKRAIQLNPRFPDAHLELGAVLEKQRDFTGAIAAFQRASELAPKNPVPHYRLSRLYARTGDTARAAEERALHRKLAAEEKAELDRRQAATRHLNMKVHQ